VDGCPAEQMCQSETVLLVDDDPDYRSIEAEVLSTEGYKVLEANGPEEAMRMAGGTAPIHLLVTDYSMPGANGLELARQFRDLYPETPVLMVSGSLPPVREEVQEDLGRFAMMEKPFVLNELVCKIRKMLADATAVPC